MKRADTWMPLYVGDYLKDTGHLTAAEHGAYLLLIMQAWTRRGSLPTDVERLRLMCRLDREEWDRVRDAVLPFFYIKGGCYRHKRVDRELNGATFNIEQRKQAGKASAEARKRQRELNENSTGVQRDCQRNVNETLNGTATEVATGQSTEGQRERRPSPSPVQKETTLRVAKKRSAVPPDWMPDAKGQAYAEARGVGPGEVPKFRNHHAAKGSLMADWSAAWRTWCDNAVSFGKAPGLPLGLDDDTVPRTAANPTGRKPSPMSGDPFA